MIIGITGLVEDPQGFRGSAGAGKDTIADILVGFGFVKMALADRIKRIAKELWSFSDEQLWGPSEMRNGSDARYVTPEGRQLTPRRALQHIGTEVARALESDVWVRCLLEDAKELLRDPKFFMYTKEEGLIPQIEQTSTGEWRRDDAPDFIRGVVISDVRFPNEVAAIRAAGGKIWRKKRMAPNNLSVSAMAHASEVSLIGMEDSEFDAVLPDDYLTELPANVKAILSRC